MDEVTVAGESPSRIRLADRVGIITRLLIGSLLAMLIAVASVQVWTLRAVEENGLQRLKNYSMAAWLC